MALVAGSTQLSTVADFMASSDVGLRVSLGLALIALIIVAIAENARIPVDNPATHLELTMVHEAMVLEYSGRHLALIELGASLKLLLYVSLIACMFVPWGIALAGAGSARYADRRRRLSRPSSRCGGFLLALFETSIAKMRVFRVPRFPRRGADARPARHAAAVRVAELLMHGLAFDIAHLLAGGLVLVSFMLLYQDRLSALLNVFALQAVVLALSVAWQAYIQDAPHLYVTAAIALVFKAIIIPVALHRIVTQLGIHREIETVGRHRPDHAGRHRPGRAVDGGDAARSTADADPLAREDLAFALSVVLLGLLMMVTRRNAVSQVVGFMSLENGLILAATGAKGMPLVVEISVAFSVLIAFIVIGIFLFRIRERFDTVDVARARRLPGRAAMSAASFDPVIGRPADPDRSRRRCWRCCPATG